RSARNRDRRAADGRRGGDALSRRRRRRRRPQRHRGRSPQGYHRGPRTDVGDGRQSGAEATSEDRIRRRPRGLCRRTVAAHSAFRRRGRRQTVRPSETELRAKTQPSLKEIAVDTQFEPRQAARFLRTLRVATGVAVAREALRRGRSAAAPASSFQALAAKTGAWRFPEQGLRAADGSGALVLQAQGAAGVVTYAGRQARVSAGETFVAEGMFDRFGALRLTLSAHEVDDAELAGLEVELLEP